VNLGSPGKKFFSIALLGFFFVGMMRQDISDRAEEEGRGREWVILLMLMNG
jgi:hypothetical protein